MWRISAHLAAVAGVSIVGGAAALADEAPNAGDIPVPTREEEWDVIEDRILKGLRALDEIALFEDKAPLWNHMDPALQAELAVALEEPPPSRVWPAP